MPSEHNAERKNNSSELNVPAPLPSASIYSSSPTAHTKTIVVARAFSCLLRLRLTLVLAIQCET